MTEKKPIGTCHWIGTAFNFPAFVLSYYGGGTIWLHNGHVWLDYALSDEQHKQLHPLSQSTVESALAQLFCEAMKSQ